MLSLSKKQKLVFYGLIRWPELNDIALSQKLDINRRTVTSIRKTLRIKGMYDTVYIPDFEALGLELLTITYGNFAQFSKSRIRIKSLSDSVANYPELIYSCISQTDFLCMYLAERFTDFKGAKDKLTKIFSEQNSLDNVISVHFPLELCRIIFMFDFAPSLKQIFKLEIEEEKEEMQVLKKKIKCRKFTEKEKIVLYALTRMPEAIDSKIAKTTKISRPTVNSIKDRLRREGIIKELKIPNVNILGYDLLVLSHCKLDLDFMKKVYSSERIKQKHALPTQPFFLATNITEPESILLLIFKNFTSYKECQDKIAKFAKDHRLSTGTVNELLFPIENLDILRNLNFAPIIKKTLDLKVSF